MKWKAANDEGKWYPQTWHWFSKLKFPGSDFIGQVKPAPFKFIALWAEWLCGKLIGHEWSETERGYHGTGTIDVWCRWCNFHEEVPIEEMPESAHLVEGWEDD